MCKAVEDYGNKRQLEGELKGKLEGIIEGELKNKIQTARNLAAMGMGISVIAKALDASEDSVREWLGIKTA